ncbi:hypothetical protein [Actinokineospora diospyrosa]|uniref:DUF4435 domain-containing protein n=1 Tax=Actinokineospora diospyrosa TaxID=103728 RepID=A0ABT1IKQ3_9PSEU|nr:hypothetical protein [Actinokineospora diospyrosa]MCP2273139.1 hypothetical protein [Actinokineospora diospyrosa]
MNLTGPEVVNTLILERQVDDRSAIVVEGQEDLQLLDIHLIDTEVYIIAAGSKTAVLSAAARCMQDGIDWAAFVIDLDTDSFEDYVDSVPIGALASSENYDMLADVLEKNPYLATRAVVSHAKPGVARSIESAHRRSIYEIALTLIEPVTALRYLAISGQLSISARKLDFTGALNSYNKGVLVDFVAGLAERRSGGKHAKSRVATLLHEVLSDKERYSIFKRTNSHDLISAISDIVRHQGKGALAHTLIAGTIRASLGCKDFQMLKAVNDLSSWAMVRGSSIFKCAALQEGTLSNNLE